MGLISRVSSRTYRPKMQIFLQDEEVETITVLPTDKISTVTNNLEEGFTLEHAGNNINLETSFAENNIEDGATINVLYPLLGGGRKRKKKVYTTPKKIKHKRVKTKLMCMKYYSVDASGKVQRKRKECPEVEICGP